MASHSFAAILYFVASDEFDVKSMEDLDLTKIVVSRTIFGKVCNNLTDKTTPIMLFLNRRDLFETRIKEDDGWASFKKELPGYKGEKKSVKESLDHMADSFMQVVEPENSNRGITVHHTCALDTGAMKVVWDSVRDGILRGAMTKAGYV